MDCIYIELFLYLSCTQSPLHFWHPPIHKHSHTNGAFLPVLCFKMNSQTPNTQSPHCSITLLYPSLTVAVSSNVDRPVFVQQAPERWLVHSDCACMTGRQSHRMGLVVAHTYSGNWWQMNSGEPSKPICGVRPHTLHCLIYLTGTYLIGKCLWGKNRVMEKIFYIQFK